MLNENTLQRYTDAQRSAYQTALSEIKGGRKQSHWMWYIFPQVKGLGFSEASRFYGINGLPEAESFLKHPVLGARLLEISKALLDLQGNDANAVFGSPDDLKLKSSMTLFASVPNTDLVFQAVLQKFFNGLKDNKTLQIIKA